MPGSVIDSKTRSAKLRVQLAISLGGNIGNLANFPSRDDIGKDLFASVTWGLFDHERDDGNPNVKVRSNKISLNADGFYAGYENAVKPMPFIILPSTNTAVKTRGELITEFD